jgi:hypothetical protein
MFTAAQYVGKRVRLSAWVKSAGVSRWSGLWMRVDGPQRTPSLAFDNMQNRAIKGTTEWQKYEVVLDVKDKATAIAFGILLDGPGAVWMNSATFEVVGQNVPTTNMTPVRPDGPTNLGFDK